jgi:Putative MetA-pathway of phenol degradation
VGRCGDTRRRRSSDPAAPIDEASATINTTGLSFTRAFNLGGRSANAGVMVPVITGHLEGLYLGERAEVSRFGQGDPRLRLAINLYGAPAMTPKEFASYSQRGIVGVSVTVAPPLGQYDASKLINLGTNRWSLKPEIGVSQALGKWVVEAMVGGWFFSDNTEFLGGLTRTQDPIAAMQVHVTYRFKRTKWLAADANYFTGGQTTLGGRPNLDLQRNSRTGPHSCPRSLAASRFGRRSAEALTRRSVPISPRLRSATTTRGCARLTPPGGAAREG